MAIDTRNNNSNLAYGFGNALQTLAPQPLLLKRNPTASDKAPLGTLASNVLTNAYFVLTSPGVWTAQSTGSASQASLEVTGGAGTVLKVDAGGNTSLGGDLAVSGDTTLTGFLNVAGAIDFAAPSISFGAAGLAVGAGDPNGVVTAPVGTLYLNSTGSTTTNRLWINTNAGTVWTYFTSHA